MVNPGYCKNRLMLVVFLALMMVLFTLVTAACQSSSQKEVVIYTSVDQIFAEDILKDFEQETGIKVRPVFDVEATKSVGLANRLIAEKDRPQCDVFWSGEFIMTIVLAQEGILEPYASPSASDIPDKYKDPDNYWTGYAGRARVLFVNTDLVKPEEYPTSIFDLIDPNRDGSKMGIAYPIFGTTLTQSAAIYAYYGEEKAREFFEKLRDNGVKVVDGNSVVRDMVVSGQLHIGLTDTDDACIAVNRGDPVEIIIPDQDGIGTLVIPNTVALIKGSPNPEEGKVLIDWLLTKEMEKTLIDHGWSHIPVRPITSDNSCIPPVEVKNMDVTFKQIFDQRDLVNRDLAEMFVR
ncbi:extracellular solute-binding protein [Desulfitibacter alkalitolerans]|uniref:extracellular solute-binding protein n=1 Tax=Desulfitibacter alkalitolerans TaxID=264641 RepID=UPI000B165651|nr:extracellular solute-binding protein [Desulfitibacter alkalitolerans]